jgi:hypothetical protein
MCVCVVVLWCVQVDAGQRHGCGKPAHLHLATKRLILRCVALCCAALTVKGVLYTWGMNHWGAGHVGAPGTGSTKVGLILLLLAVSFLGLRVCVSSLCVVPVVRQVNSFCSSSQCPVVLVYSLTIAFVPRLPRQRPSVPAALKKENIVYVVCTDRCARATVLALAECSFVSLPLPLSACAAPFVALFCSACLLSVAACALWLHCVPAGVPVLQKLVAVTHARPFCWSSQLR